MSDTDQITKLLARLEHVAMHVHRTHQPDIEAASRMLTALAAEREELKAKCAELERDRARLEWLEDNAESIVCTNDRKVAVIIPHDIRAAIDAAMAKGTP